MSPIELLSRRAERALGHVSLDELRGRYRAIVGPPRQRDALVISALEKLKTGSDMPTPEERAALEEAIRIFRPSVVSHAGKLGTLPVGCEEAFSEWTAFAARFGDLAYAVGRIDLPRDPWDTARQPVGTGFLVRPDVLVTNRHVARVLQRGGDQVVPGEAVVYLGQESKTVPDRSPERVMSCIALHSAHDLALLRLETTSTTPRPVLEVEPRAAKAGDQVAVVGYPCDDPLRNPLFARSVFFGGYEVKQAAPGEVMEANDPTLSHDCSTLGGNSGSPVLSLSTGRVVGVHFEGGFLVRNEAVSASVLERFISDALG